jgi:NADH-quinone oxidoreductase subunit N
VSFYSLIEDAIRDTLHLSLGAFVPELILCGAIIALLLVRTIYAGRHFNAIYVMFLGAAASLYFLAPWQHFGAAASPTPTFEFFTGMLVYDKFSIYMRGLILGFVALFAVFTRLSGIPRREDSTEFTVLVLGAALGMCLMVSANHMLVVFLGMEMASVPSYVLAATQRFRRKSSEAALKYAVFGAATAGIMLYGISLLVGALGSAHIPTMAAQLSALAESGLGGQRALVLVLGGLMVMIGLAFKLSAVPFPFWAPDVFEGATAEVAAFLSIASKTAALALLVRIALGLCHTTPEQAAGMAPVQYFIAGLIVLLSAVTCTFGNLAAYGQTNIKRLLAYSTIAHAGYMMMPVAAAVVLSTKNADEASSAVAAMAFYAAVYLFMNLGAFAVAAFLRNALQSEQIADYSGLIRRSPGLAVCFAVILFSLIGVPPLAGFAAKFTIFASLFDAGLLLLLGIGVLNTVLGLFYYLRVVRVMAFPSETPCAARIPLASLPGLFCLAMAAPLLVFGIWWNNLFGWAQSAASVLF